MQKSKVSSHLFKIVLTGVLIALNVILERFLAYSVWNQTISLGFITVAFAASFLGIPYAIAVAGLGDLIGSLLFPFGTYFAGFTITNCLYALITAIFIHKNATALKVMLSVILNKLICSLALNTIWISLLYRGGIDAFPAVFVTRIPQALIMGVIEIAVILILFWKKSKIKILLDKNINRII
ncbi:MAG: folate family ECF transporter S component [Clostridia bacterium]|nr:folate family ECF transporter S component [Clostridia bacterium]